ncbi:hypothetical protein ACVI1J_002296 [Bradyrhizobium diazoefficiens]
MNATPTRTYNPLPFTDLEPKRFEDLVRQLVYDFRPWRRLEATGRSGSDDGFDARALEIVEAPDATAAVDQDEPEDETPTDGAADRLWLIQCKRERTITPAKLKGYLAEISLAADEKLHGIIFAAACDFSKASRDAFYAWCRGQGISEAVIWGKGELEDQLYQPKNDNLLFAYFGISLTIRRRSQVTQIRAEIATKRKLMKTVGKSSTEILLRDPTDIEYPETPEGKLSDKWRVYNPERLTHRGLEVSVRWFHAYFEPETGAWDAGDAVEARHLNSRWNIPDPKKERLNEIAGATWQGLPDENKAWVMVTGIIPFANIIAIDDMGDEIVGGAHIYVPFVPNKGPFEYFIVRLETVGIGRSKQWGDPNPETRVVKFPSETRKMPKPGTV